MTNSIMGESRASSEVSDEFAGPEDSLLTPSYHSKKTQDKSRKWTTLALFVWAVLATAGAIAMGALYDNQRGKVGGGNGQSPSNSTLPRFPPKGKRNVVFMVSDGMGPASLQLTRSWRQYVDKLPFEDTLFLDKHLIGTSRTRSSNSLVTDSAAGATAFSCAQKSYNGAVSVLPNRDPCGTILEAAKKKGYMTGLVVTTRITDATPACFSAHANRRSEEDRIAEQQIGDYPLGRMVDLMLGGGRCRYMKKSLDGSCRADERDVIADAQKIGFNYISDRAGFDSLQMGKNVSLPLLGLFARGDIPYEIDRDNAKYPALWEMAKTAITALADATKDNEEGFFLMVEGSRIDHAGHSNDPAAQVREVLAYDKAFKEMVEWIEGSDIDGVVVSTSDHETGGLANARQLSAGYPDYLWYPGVLANATHSGEYLQNVFGAFKSEDNDKIEEFTKTEILEKGLGIFDATDDEIKKLIEKRKTGAGDVMTDIVSRRAQIGWSTHGHSGVDVNIYGTKSARGVLLGNHENTEVGKFLQDYMELDLDAVTAELKEKGFAKMKNSVAASTEFGEGDGHNPYPWMGKTIEELEGDGFDSDHVDCYHGDFKREIHSVSECTVHKHDEH